MLKIKESKTQLMKFNSAKTLDFPPELFIEGFSDLLEVTKETKLLGLMVTDDLKWEANTNYICAKAYKKMWTLRRMKVLDLEPYVMLDVYAKEIRSLLFFLFFILISSMEQFITGSNLGYFTDTHVPCTKGSTG